MRESDSDPSLRALLDYVARRPGVVKRERWGETFFAFERRTLVFVGKPGDATVTVKVRRRDRERLLRRADVERDRYLGWFGWLTVRVRDADSLQLALRLIDQSYERATAAPGAD